MKLIPGVLCLTVLIPFACFGAGGVGADFLRLEPPAKTAAMSNVFAGVADDISSIVFNPAGLINVTRTTATFTHFASFVDTNCEFLAGAYPLDKKYGVAAAAVIFNYTFDFTEYDDYGDDVGNVDSYDVVAIASYAYPFTSWLSAGVNAKYFYSKLYKYDKNGFAVDAGLFLHMGSNPDTFAGLTIQNLGTQTAYISVVDPMPVNIKGGMGMKVKVADVAKVTLGLDVNRLMSKDETPTLDLGADCELWNVFCVRAGYGFRHDVASFSAGVGIRMDKLLFSYSYQPFDMLGATHRISVDVEIMNGPENKEAEKTDDTEMNLVK